MHEIIEALIAEYRADITARQQIQRALIAKTDIDLADRNRTMALVMEISQQNALRQVGIDALQEALRRERDQQARLARIVAATAAVA